MVPVSGPCVTDLSDKLTCLRLKFWLPMFPSFHLDQQISDEWQSSREFQWFVFCC